MTINKASHQLNCRISSLLLLFLLFKVSYASEDDILGESVQKLASHFKETVSDTFDDVFESVEDLLGQSTLAGQITPILQKFLLSKAELKAIWDGIRQVAELSDIIFLVVVGFCLVPTMQVPYEHWILSPEQKSFKSTKTYHVMESISQMAKIAMLVYLVDIIKIFLIGAGFHFPREDRIVHAFSYVAYTVWAALRMSDFKSYVLCKWTGATEGKLELLNRLVDTFLFFCAGYVILDILNMEMGLAARGFVAFGSVTTLVISLASKEIVTNVLYGIVLSASDRIYVGDSIKLNKAGFSGKVVKLGWLETVLRGSDEIQITLPNSSLLSQQVSNLSRIHQCQVKETLRFAYKDSEKLPQLMRDIKDEIRANCPAVITDGSRPFRVHWVSYKGDYLEVVVDSYFRIKPIGDAYYDNRQRVLQAIDRAVKKNNMEFKMAE